MSRNNNGFGKFVFGLGIGVGLGILFAPQEGSKTRKELKIKMDELLEKVKAIDPEDVKTEIFQKVEELRMEIQNLDKERAVEIAKNSAKKIGEKAADLYDYAKVKSTPVVEKAVKEVKDVTLKAAKEVVNRLEEDEKKNVKNSKINNKSNSNKKSSNNKKTRNA